MIYRILVCGIGTWESPLENFWQGVIVKVPGPSMGSKVATRCRGNQGVVRDLGLGQLNTMC